MRIIILIIAIAIANTASAQAFFKPLPNPTASQKRSLIARDSTGAPVATAIYQNNFRPIAGVTASLFGDGAQLAGGTGISFQRNRFDNASQEWVTEYSISGLLFLDTKASVLAGLVFGLANGLIQLGPGWNTTTGKFVILTGIGIKFN